MLHWSPTSSPFCQYLLCCCRLNTLCAFSPRVKVLWKGLGAERFYAANTRQAILQLYCKFDIIITYEHTGPTGLINHWNLKRKKSRIEWRRTDNKLHTFSLLWMLLFAWVLVLMIHRSRTSYFIPTGGHCKVFPLEVEEPDVPDQCVLSGLKDYRVLSSIPPHSYFFLRFDLTQLIAMFTVSVRMTSDSLSYLISTVACDSDPEIVVKNTSVESCMMGHIFPAQSAWWAAESLRIGVIDQGVGRCVMVGVELRGL